MKLLARITICCTLLTSVGSACAASVAPFAEVLVWHASEDTSSVWASVITNGNPSTFAASQIEFDWDPGLRTGFTVASELSGWDFKCYWTYFQTSQADSIPTGNHIVIPEFFSGFLSGDSLSFTSGAVDWSLNYNTFDFELGHQIDVSETLIFRPWVGLKVAFIDQNIAALWADVPNGLVGLEHLDHEFSGLGPSFGASARWTVSAYGNLSLIGSFSGTFLSGVWNVEDTYQRVNPAPTFNTFRSYSTSMNDVGLGTLMLNYFCGLEWILPGDTIKLHLGYEMQWWANQQRFTMFQQLPMHGDLTLQGVSCGISVDF